MDEKDIAQTLIHESGNAGDESLLEELECELAMLKLTNSSLYRVLSEVYTNTLKAIA